MNNNYIVEFKNVTRLLSGKKVLDDLSFYVERGETFVIVGPSGTGKSVTLKHIIGLLTPDYGSVYVFGKDIAHISYSELQKIRDRFGVLFQGGALLAWLNIKENVALPLREKTNFSEEEIEDRVYEVLKVVGLDNDAYKMPAEISGGMRKRAALARAIVLRPEVILYDEPTSGLDPVTSRKIDELIDKLKHEFSVTNVVVTHDLQSALSIGSRIAMLWQGKFIEIATPSEFLRSNIKEVQNFLESQYITRKGKWEAINETR